MPPSEMTALTDAERALVQQVADQRGISFEEAANQLQSEALANAVKRGVGRVPAQTYTRPTRGLH